LPVTDEATEGERERRHLLIVNPSAGGGRGAKRLPAVERALGHRRVAYRKVETESMADGCRLAREAAAAGEIPVVMSGDGMVGKIGGALAGGEVPLGIIPGGRGNDLARVLGIPTEPAEAVAVLAGGASRRIDVGEANGERFLGIASCGFDSDANRIANQARLVKGPLVYAYAALRALALWSPAHFVVSADGSDHPFTGYSVAVANSKAYGGGMFVAPDAELDDGLLDLVLTGEVSKLRFLVNLPKVFKGRHIDNEEVSTLRAGEVEVSADRPFAVFADGEHITDLPVRIRVLPGALSVIAPTAP
jgi:YegS/Rv2252/BmrU family lipid kinase